MLQLFKIAGDSLFPFYKNGEKVLCLKVYKTTHIAVDDTVVFEKEAYGHMIKKVKRVVNNAYFVEGTSPFSIDSRNFGSLDFEEIKYKVLFKF